MSYRQCWFAWALHFAAALFCATARGEIYRWDNGQLIPGTQGITPGRGVQLDHRNLQNAELQYRDLAGSRFDFSNLTRANLASSYLESATFTSADLTEVNLTSAYMYRATLTNANLSGAIVIGANLQSATSRGFTKEQLYSTASYQAKDLRGINLGTYPFPSLDPSRSNLSGWDFSGQDLRNATFESATLTNANLTGANLTGAVFRNAMLANANFTGAVVAEANFMSMTSGGFTKEQLYPTASYEAKDLHGIVLREKDLTGWEFSGQDLAGAVFVGAIFTNANLALATVAGANFSSATLAKEQLYSTASYQARDLRGIVLGGNNVTGWDFSGQNLTGAQVSDLTNAEFTGAVVAGAVLPGLTKEQLYSTASYQARDLRGIGLGGNDLTGWDFSEQNLTGASVSYATVTNANFTDAVVAGADFRGDLRVATRRGITKEQLYSSASYKAKDLHGIRLWENDLTGWDLSGQNLTGAQFIWVTLTNVDLTGAVVAGADFGGTTSRGFTKEQLYSTASYQAKDLHGIILGGGDTQEGGNFGNDLTGWDFNRQNLTYAHFVSSTLANANLSGANLANAQLQYANLANSNLTGADVTNSNFVNAYLPAANLTGATLTNATLTNANMTGADTRGASGLNPAGASTTNLIHPDGRVHGLNLAGGEKLVAYGGVPIPVKFSADYSIAPTATFDLTDNDAIVQSSAATKAADLARLYGHVKQGYHGGDWHGSGITSSTAGADPKHDTTLTLADNARLGYTHFSGQPVTAESILLKYTYYGDVDLNGAVDADDLTVFANSFGRATGAVQTDGDIDFDGAVDADDLTVFANNFGKGVGNPLGVGAIATIPEPTSLVLAGLAAAGILAGIGIRRWRNSWDTRRLLRNGAATSVLFAISIFSSAARGDIYRWDTGAVIPGTEWIVPGPGPFSWDPSISLEFADLASTDLSAWSLVNANLTSARLTGSNLTNASLAGATLTDADLTAANLSMGDLGNATLKDVKFVGAKISGARFTGTTHVGFTKEQLYSTASYQAMNLHGIILGGSFVQECCNFGNDLTGWDFSGQDLTGADLTNATLTNAVLTGAVVTGARFGNFYTTSASSITKEQLYSTASYQAKDLRGIGFQSNDLTGWDFRGQNLTGAFFGSATLTNADLAGANLTNAVLVEARLANADLSGANLTGVNFFRAHLPNANFTNAILTDVDLTKADARGAIGLNLASTATTNLIRPDGQIIGLRLIQEYLTAAPGVPIPVKFTSGFSITNSGRLDLTDNDAIVESRDFPALRRLVKEGYHGGDWMGEGISSSTSAANAAHGTGISVADNALLGYTQFAGQPVTAESILLKYTYYGDVDLNGQVDADDLTVFANNFGRSTGAVQTDGDIDFDGDIDADDLTLFGNNFGKGAGNPLAAGVVATIPEPATATLAGLAAACLLAGIGIRRGRKS